MEVGRQEYEELIQPLLDRTMDCVQRALDDARLTAAAIDKALPLYVPGWTTGPPPSWPSRSRRPATAPTTNPLASALANVARSGVTPNSSWPPPGPTRKPDTI